MRLFYYGYGLALIFTLSSCTKDYIDPSRALNEEALSSSQALTDISIGLQRTYSYLRTSNIYNKVTANGFVTNELLLRNEGNIPELQLSTGGSTVDGTNTVLAGLWTSSNKIIYDANLVIQNARRLADKNRASGIIAYTTVLKALSLGDLAMKLPLAAKACCPAAATTPSDATAPCRKLRRLLVIQTSLCD